MVSSPKCRNELSKIVIADSGSDDNTHKILLELQKELPQLEILSNTKKEHGPKVIALYDYAIKNHCDYIFQTDCDGQTNPQEFDAFWRQRKDYDAIFGNRTKRGDGMSRALVARVVCILVKLFFGVAVPVSLPHPQRLQSSQYYLDSIFCLLRRENPL